MVRAILEKKKSQTRRLVKGLALDWLEPEGFTPEYVALPENRLCPYGNAGDRLWVREGCEIGFDGSGKPIMATFPDADGWQDTSQGFVLHPQAPAGAERWCLSWRRRPSIFMPRWASRLTLEVTEVRVQRLREITDEDARAEGVRDDGARDHVGPFSVLWSAINGKRAAWASDPWVWAISFRRAAA